jgi:hypothetical protein
MDEARKEAKAADLDTIGPEEPSSQEPTGIAFGRARSRRPYRSPHLRSLGMVSDLTFGGGTTTTDNPIAKTKKK